MVNSFRDALLRKSYRIYTGRFKQTQLGKFVARQILDLGLVSRLDIQAAELSGLNKINTRPFENSRYASEVTSVELPNFHLSAPLNFQVSEELSGVSYINVLLPSLQVKHMSGGPNTALFFASLLAEYGEYIRLIACDSPTEDDGEALYAHMDSLLLRPVMREKIELVDGFDRSKPVFIGKSDIFFATAWWTAQIAKYGIEKTIYKSFIYLIQDFEPILHEGSTFQVRAFETYGLSHIPLINTKLLLEHLVQEKSGFYANKDFSEKALVFEPALDRNYYFPDPSKPGENKKKVLLFYARPTVARRNLFEIGIVALKQAVASGAISNEHWDVWAMGEKLSPIALGNDVYLNPLPWLSFEDYAKRVRTADLLLSLMLSPHPSYPPLEMAASGNLVVTNSFSVKTADRMKQFSPNIIVAEPTPQSIASALERAVGRINAGLSSYDTTGTINLPTDWEDSLKEIIPELINRLSSLRFSPPAINNLSLTSGSPIHPQNDYEVYRKNQLEQRRRSKKYKQQLGLLSFVTSAYNTPSQFLIRLGHSLFVQDGGMNFEWLILDNGSTDKETIAALKQLSRYPSVRLERVENNLGIIGGMRYLLENARNQYILPLDSDDLLEPDCVNILTSHICDNDYPPLLYTDEDKVSDSNFHSPYFKPDWDPVLFLHSCYIAHLCAIDREKALALDLYTDETAEGCHDWDTFIRFMRAGYTPHHIPEVLYSWRIHTGSTSGNISSKDYITNSHQETLKRALEARHARNIELLPSPLFNHNVDWWFRRKRDVPISCETIVLKSSDNIVSLFQKVKDFHCNLVHICWENIVLDDDEWRWDAAALIELFPDTVMVGGTLHNAKTALGGPCVFGFGNGFGCPDIGRSLADPGYFAWMHKARSVSAVSTGHCVVALPFLAEALPILVEEKISLTMLGPWLGALAAETRRRVVFSPFMRAQALRIPEDSSSSQDQASFLSKFWHLIPDSRFYSERLGLTSKAAYSPASSLERRQHVQFLQAKTLPYSEWLEQHINRRLKNYPLPDKPVTISLITSIYEGTKIALLGLLADSVVSQTLKPSEWIIVAHGPLSDEDLSYVQRLAAEKWDATVIVEPRPLGIMKAMRVALEASTSEYIVPIDADDLLTHDALQILAHHTEKLGAPDLLYSDEDLLVDGKPSHPYLRSSFDPILNLDSSYVWHLCAIKRESALALDLYVNQGATWCHDWDSITRIANARGKIEHIPEILYHWRQHKESTTNNANGDPRSLESVHHVLSGQIARTANPEDYYIADWPINRGSRELYIARHPGNIPNFVWFDDVRDDQSYEGDESAIVVFAAKGISISSHSTYLEVARLFDLHSNLGAIGGLTLNNANTVVDACYVANQYGKLESPWIGREENYHGPYALAMKPQAVFTAGRSLVFFRVSALKDIGFQSFKNDDFNPNLIFSLCGRIIERNWIVGFSPMVRAYSSAAFQDDQDFDVSISEHFKIDYAIARYCISRSFLGEF
jgi:glycosyltransferase involved in cell wall biosynthesis